MSAVQEAVAAALVDLDGLRLLSMLYAVYDIIIPDMGTLYTLSLMELVF